MKVLIVATTSYAGMGPYVSEIVNTFLPEDEVYYLFRESSDDFFKKNIKQELVKHCYFCKENQSIFKRIISLIYNTRGGFSKKVIDFCLNNGIEVVHFINGSLNNYLLKALKAKNICILNTVHDLHPHEMKKAFWKEWRCNILMKRVLYGVKHCNNLTTNSRLQYNELKKCFPEKNISFHEFPSLVTERIANGRKSISELKSCNKPYILFFGRIEAYKGINFLYNSYVNSKDLYDNYALVIAGSGELGFDIKTSNKDIYIINRYIDDEEVSELYKNAKAVVYPYISATQSGVLSLAFYFHKPVLTSDIQYFKSIVEEYGVGMTFKTQDSGDLRKQLLNMLKSDVKDMIKRQSEYYFTYYSNEAIREQLLKIYQDVK